jgi:hypothetical protein
MRDYYIPRQYIGHVIPMLPPVLPLRTSKADKQQTVAVAMGWLSGQVFGARASILEVMRRLRKRCDSRLQVRPP